MRRAILSRRTSLTPGPLPGLPHRPLFDPLLVARALEDVLHEDPWRDHVIRIQLAWLDELFDLGNGDRRGRRHHRVEVPGRASIYKVAEPVAFPGLDERKVGAQGLLEHVPLAVDDTCLFAFGDD